MVYWHDDFLFYYFISISNFALYFIPFSAYLTVRNLLTFHNRMFRDVTKARVRSVNRNAHI